ncbi:MAG TPA: toll/interleukin-1 receptor domain-containing protein [Pseudonocardiaceae bacterium]
MSQVLLGLLTRPHLVRGHDRALAALTVALLDVQAPCGGWPLRIGDDPGITFAFYPALALTRLFRNSSRRHAAAEASLRATATHLAEAVTAPGIPLVERVLGQFALERVTDALGMASPVPADHGRQVLAACLVDGRELALRDHLIVIDRQPAWHSLTWHPLLYLCARRWAPPLDRVCSLLGLRLIDGFDRSLRAWTGPARAVAPGAGTSWASCLALNAVSALGRDLAAHGVTPGEFVERARALVREPYEYDVAISFSGSDRAVAEAISDALKAAGLRVFYDRDHEHLLLGEDLAVRLQETYLEQSRFAIVVVSRAFVASRWAGNWEWRAVQARMQQQRSGYVLPYIMEDVVVPGLNPTIGHVLAAERSPEEFAALVIRKIRALPVRDSSGCRNDDTRLNDLGLSSAAD